MVFFRRGFIRMVKVMLHETIRNDDFWCNTALQHCWDIVSNGYNIVPTLQLCVALKIVVANRPGNITFTLLDFIHKLIM